MSVKELPTLQEKFQTEMIELTKNTKYCPGEMIFVNPFEALEEGLKLHETARTLDLE